jgi:choline dehydrogenase-like flavoprotein
MTGVTEDEALAENRITLSPRKDALGVPLASVDYTPSKASLALWDAAIAEGLEVFRAAGTSEAWNGPRGPMHIMGGTVMGASADDSVTNSYGQTHDLPNLFVGGAGLFPTSGGVNPTFTVHALAARSSEYLVKNWDSVIG